MARARKVHAPPTTLALPGMSVIAAASDPKREAKRAAEGAANDVGTKVDRLTLADLAAIDAQANEARAAKAAPPTDAKPRLCPAYGCGAELDARARYYGWSFCWDCQGDAGTTLQTEEASQRMTPRHAAIVERMICEIARRQGRKIPRPLTAAEVEAERLAGERIRAVLEQVPQLESRYPRRAVLRFELTEATRAVLRDVPSVSKVIRVADLPPELRARVESRMRQEGRDHIFTVVEGEAADEFRKMIVAANRRYEEERAARGEAGIHGPPVEGDCGPSGRGRHDVATVEVYLRSSEETDEHAAGREAPLHVQSGSAQDPGRPLADEEPDLYAPRIDDACPDDEPGPDGSGEEGLPVGDREDDAEDGRGAVSRWDPRSPRFEPRAWWAHFKRQCENMRVGRLVYAKRWET